MLTDALGNAFNTGITRAAAAVVPEDFGFPGASVWTMPGGATMSPAALPMAETIARCDAASVVDTIGVGLGLACVTVLFLVRDSVIAFGARNFSETPAMDYKSNSQLGIIYGA